MPLIKTELVTTLKRKATEIISELQAERDPILITQHGLPATYLVDVATYEEMNRRISVLEGSLKEGRRFEKGAFSRKLKPSARCPNG